MSEFVLLFESDLKDWKIVPCLLFFSFFQLCSIALNLVSIATKWF